MNNARGTGEVQNVARRPEFALFTGFKPREKCIYPPAPHFLHFATTDNELPYPPLLSLPATKIPSTVASGNKNAVFVPDFRFLPFLGTIMRFLFPAGASPPVFGAGVVS